jgi:hypothetical protein
MKHFFYILSFLSIGLAACTGCTKKNTSTPVCTGPDCVQPTTPVVPDASLHQPDAGLDSTQSSGNTPDFKTISRNGFELTVPQEWEEFVIDGEEPQPELVVGNEEEHNLILLVKDPFTGTPSEYVLEAMQGFKKEGAKVTSSKQTELNGNKFIALDSSRGGARIWLWITVKNGFGYVLSCGGPESETHHEEICRDVAKSLKIH